MRIRPLPPVNGEIASLTVAGFFFAMGLEVLNNPDDIRQAGLYLFVILVAMLGLIGFEWPFLTSDSEGSRLFYRISPIVIFVLSPVVVFFGSQREPYDVPAYSIPENPTPQESAMFEALDEILQSAGEEPTLPNTFVAEEAE